MNVSEHLLLLFNEGDEDAPQWALDEEEESGIYGAWSVPITVPDGQNGVEITALATWSENDFKIAYAYICIHQKI